MNIGTNLQFLRRQQKITQEHLAERLGVSRQTVSRWESGEVIPELSKLVELCEVFSCKLDALVREDLTAHSGVYSEIFIRRVEEFTMGRYLMVSPNPEADVQAYLRRWGERSGLLAIQPDAVMIGWDWPYVTQEQQNRFGLRGYAAAYILPEGFEPACPGVELACQQAADYAVITIYDPFAAAFERIPNAYKRLLAHLQASGFKGCPPDHALSCFERVYEQNGVTCMDVHLLVAGVSKSDTFTDFNK